MHGGMTQAAHQHTPERTSRHSHKPLPTAEEQRGMAALALSKVSLKGRKKHRYGALAGRLHVLRELGSVAKSHGDQAARTIADRIVDGLAGGSLSGSKHARYKVRELAHRLRQAWPNRSCTQFAGKRPWLTSAVRCEPETYCPIQTYRFLTRLRQGLLYC